MHKYRLVAKKGEGTFSEVLKAQCIKNGKYVAIKCMKNHFDSLDQVNNLREIQALRRLSPHPNIIKLLEVLYDQPTGRLALVFELMDMNIYELIRGRRHYVAEDRVKNYMYQLMKAMDHMHRNGIFHRDIKPENILIMDDCLKLADFGSCRGIYSKQPYTEYISTRWYRAPECLLTDGYYNYKMDMWGVGCVFFEIVSLFPLFPGTNELDQIQKIHNILGTPPEELLKKMKKRSAHMDFNFPSKEGSGIAKLIPHVSPDCCDLVTKLLMYNPDDRLSARQALRHPYFKELREAEKKQKALNTPDLAPGVAVAGGVAGHEQDKARAQASSPAGSDDNTMLSPPETGRQMSESSGGMGLPTIHAKSTMHLGQTAREGSGDHHTAGESEALADSAHRLPGLHAQSSQVSLDGATDDSALPPIAGSGAGGGATSGAAATGSCAKLNAGISARRGAVSYYEPQYAKKQTASVTSSAAATALSRRQSMGPGTLPKYTSGGSVSNKSTGNGGGGAGTGMGGGNSSISSATGGGAIPSNNSTLGGSSGSVASVANTSMGKEPSYKTKANYSKQPSKYVSPYSLRTLAVKE